MAETNPGMVPGDPASNDHTPELSPAGDRILSILAEAWVVCGLISELHSHAPIADPAAQVQAKLGEVLGLDDRSWAAARAEAAAKLGARMGALHLATVQARHRKKTDWAEAILPPRAEVVAEASPSPAGP